MTKRNTFSGMMAMFFLLASGFELNAQTKKVAVSVKEVAIPVRYTAPDKGFLSLALYSENDQLVRSLLYAEPVEKGNGTITWDGTSDLGVPQPAGTYSTKAIFFKDKTKLDYVMTVGKSGNPPYRTRDGKGSWGGNFGGPVAVCSNSDSVMMVWGCVENHHVTGIQQMDANGNIKMRYFHSTLGTKGQWEPWMTRIFILES
ncbi:hypothetical protein OAG71_00080 [bacterium]|nr:hypothetical protein [bacterium]